MQGVQWLLQKSLEKAGYRFQQLRAGETQIGVWKLALRPRKRGFAKVRRIVLVPGFGDTPLSWILTVTALKPVLSRDYDELVCLEFPGFSGFLREHPAIESVDRMLEWAGDALEGLAPTALMGHSLGGWLAADFALRLSEGGRPKKAKKVPLEKLILIAPSGVFGTARERREFEDRFKSISQRGFQVLREVMFEKEPAWFRWVERDMDSFTRRPEVHKFINSFEERHRLESRLAALQGSVWIIWGERDRMVPASFLPHWHRALHGASAQVRSVSLKGVGHTPQVEAPAVLAAVLGQILLGQEPHWAGTRFWQVWN
jgi:pimeloyl-ACP methyl ester carboxylesterase